MSLSNEWNGNLSAAKSTCRFGARKWRRSTLSSLTTPSPAYPLLKQLSSLAKLVKNPPGRLLTSEQKIDIAANIVQLALSVSGR